jgi:hypothetical protein
MQCARAAAGLQLAPGAGQTTRTWIVYNKPAAASYTHAGMLMGLGLTGARTCSSHRSSVRGHSPFQLLCLRAIPLPLNHAPCKPCKQHTHKAGNSSMKTALLTVLQHIVGVIQAEPDAPDNLHLATGSHVNIGTR